MVCRDTEAMGFRVPVQNPNPASYSLRGLCTAEPVSRMKGPTLQGCGVEAQVARAAHTAVLGDVKHSTPSC